MGLGTALAAGASLIGGAMSARSSRKAAEKAAEAARFRMPFIGLPGGTQVQIRPSGDVYGQLGDKRQMLMETFDDQALQYAQANLAPQLPELMARQGLLAAQQADVALPGARNQLFQQLAEPGLLNMQGGRLAMDFTRQNQQAGLLTGDAMGLFGRAGTYADRILGGGAQDVADQRLALLREQAAPFEQRQFNRLQNNLFSTGRLGITGGGLQTEAFARGLGQADLARQVEAQNMGLQQQQFAQGLLGTASGLGQLGIQGVGAQRHGTQNLTQLLEGLDTAGLNRAQQRMQAAEGLFGFARDVGDYTYGAAQNRLAGAQNIETGLRNLIALSGNIASQQATAGANQAQYINQQGGSAIGGLLSGLGTSFLQNRINAIDFS